MKGLFNDNRPATILHMFQSVQDMTVHDMATRLGVSDRTIRNDIKALNKTLAGSASIEGKRGRYALRVFDETRFLEILADVCKSDDLLNSSRNRMDYLFGRLMRANMPLIIDDLAYEMSVGRTTLVGDLKKLREELRDYNLTIEGKTGRGITLYGNEGDVRRYVLDVNYDAIYQDYPLDSETEEVIREYCEHEALEAGAQRNFRRFVVLMLDRFFTGHYIGQLSAQAYNLSSRPEFAAVSDAIDRLGKQLSTEFPIEEKLFVFMPIMGMRTPADIRGMRSIELDESMRPLLPMIVDQIHKDMNLNISLGDFTEEFLYHLMFMINRMRFGIKLTNPLIDEMRDKYPLAFQVAGIASEVIAREYGFEVSEDEQAYLAAYFGVFLSESQYRMEKRFRIVAVYAAGRITGRLLEMQLRRVIGGNGDLTMLSVEEATPARLEEFDLILTTVEIENVSDIPIITVSEVVQEQDLRSRIEKARYWGHMEYPTLDSNWFVIAGLLDERQFSLFGDGTSYEQALDAMVARLSEDGLVDDGFGERLRQRERQGLMAFGESIALPHSIQYAWDRVVLAVGIFERPVHYGNCDISIVFMLGLPERIEDDDRFLIRAYDEIITISQDEGLRKKIAAARTYQQLRQALFRKAD